jgi:DNA-binding transcriptional LysR family regulator
MMRLEAIRSFIALVETGSYTAAAEALFLSPTTVHGHVRSLEDELGASLVSFTNRKLGLTRAGSRFLLFAKRSLSEFDETRDDIAGIAHQDAARLHVVSLHGPSIHLLPPVIRAFEQERPGIRVSVEAKGVGESFAALISGQADLIISNEIHTDLATGHYTFTDLYEDDLVLVVRPEDYQPPDVELLTRFPVATQLPVSRYRQYLEKWAREREIPLWIAYEHTAFDGIVSFVLEGNCIGMVAGYMARFGPFRDRLRVLDLPGFELRRTVIGVHSVQPDPLTEEFMRFFRRFFQQQQCQHDDSENR